MNRLRFRCTLLAVVVFATCLVGTLQQGRAAAQTVPAAQASSSVPKSDMEGLYSVTISSARDTLGGLLVVADGHGWLSLDLATFPVSRVLRNAHGAVLVTVDGARALVFDGHRTRDGGFTARATGKDSSRAESAWLTAKPTTLPLSDTRGLYDASCRTEAHSASVRKQLYVDWKGVAAVATNGGKIFIYLRLWNDKGGSTGIFGDAPLADDGSFSMDRGESFTNFVVLAGHVTPGEIVARWRDRRTSESEFQCEIALTRK